MSAAAACITAPLSGIGDKPGSPRSRHNKILYLLDVRRAAARFDCGKFSAMNAATSCSQPLRRDGATYESGLLLLHRNAMPLCGMQRTPVQSLNSHWRVVSRRHVRLPRALASVAKLPRTASSTGVICDIYQIQPSEAPPDPQCTECHSRLKR